LAYGWEVNPDTDDGVGYIIYHGKEWRREEMREEERRSDHQ
jgi:hypothetical protein